MKYRTGLLGLGFIWSWIYCFFPASLGKSAVGNTLLATPSIWVISAASVALTLFVLPFVLKRVSITQQRVRLCVIATIVLVAGTIFGIFADTIHAMSLLLVYACGVFTGVGSGLFYFCWGEMYRRFDIENIELGFLGSLAIVIVFSLLTSFISPSLLIILLLLLPLLSMLFFIKSERSDVAEEKQDTEQDIPATITSGDKEVTRIFLFSFGSLVVIAFLWEILRFREGGSPETKMAAFALGLIVAVLIIWHSIQHTRQFNLLVLYRWALPFMALAVTLSVLFDAEGLFIAYALLAAVHLAFETMAKIHFTSLSKKMVDSTKVLCWGYMSIHLGAALGILIWTVLKEYLDTISLFSLEMLALCVFILLVSFFLKNTVMISASEERAIPAEKKPGFSVPTQTIGENAAAKFGLSSREVEVFLLLAQGRSRAYVREALHISKSTVDTHTRHIYEKMGISSRDELMEIADNLIKQT